MRLTESQLREIIRTELSEFYEKGAHPTTEDLMKKFGIKTIPLNPNSKTTLKGMKKEGFLDRITAADAVFYYAYIQNKYGVVKEKNMQEFISNWNSSVKWSYPDIGMESVVLAYNISRLVVDMKNSGEEIQPIYHIVKEYFKNFGMDHGRSKLFDRTVKELDGWAKRKRIKTL
jgi:hypothetical protein